METVEVLRKARELIADPSSWATGWYAYDHIGKKVRPSSEGACCWCVFGAMDRVCGGAATDEAIEAMTKASLELYGVESFSHVNDKYGHKAALAMLDKAISIASLEPKP